MAPTTSGRITAVLVPTMSACLIGAWRQAASIDTGEQRRLFTTTFAISQMRVP